MQTLFLKNVHCNPPELRSAQPAAAAAMASTSSSRPHNANPFDLRPWTPSGLASRARLALLRNSPATRAVWLTDRPTQTGSFGLSVWVHRGLRSVGLDPSGFSSPVGLGLTVRSRDSAVI